MRTKKDRGRGSRTDGCEPLLKWPGGKRTLLASLLPLIPRGFERYFEPFLGGGALFFRIQPARAFLSDSNEELVSCYQQLRDNPAKVMAYLSQFKNSKSQYYKIRSSVSRSAAKRAARVIYLTTLSFNGIYRENLQGEFNVPYGHKRHLEPLQPERIREISRALEGTKLECLDFEVSVERAGEGDLVYLDPPYTVAHGNNGFLRYNARVFSWYDQARLARTAHNLRRRGCLVIMTNACHPSIRKLYQGFLQLVVVRPSRVAASATYRRPVKELIITNVL